MIPLEQSHPEVAEHLRLIVAGEHAVRALLRMKTTTENGRLKTRLTDKELKEDIERMASKPYQARKCCVRCGERITGVMALTATLCCSCADDDINGR